MKPIRLTLFESFLRAPQRELKREQARRKASNRQASTQASKQAIKQTSKHAGKHLGGIQSEPWRTEWWLHCNLWIVHFLVHNLDFTLADVNMASENCVKHGQLSFVEKACFLLSCEESCFIINFIISKCISFFSEFINRYVKSKLSSSSYSYILIFISNIYRHYATSLEKAAV